MKSGSFTRPLAFGVLVLLGACATKRVEVPLTSTASPMANANVAASLVVDQFLRAANSNDLDTMARLFGTREGSELKRDPKDLIDKRMFAIASVLRYDSYKIKGNEIVPGRRDEATRLIVTMNFGERSVDVPYTLVYSKDKTWLVEQIGVDAITGK